MTVELARIIKTIAQAKTCNNGQQLGCNQCLDQLSSAIDWFAKTNQPIQFVLPAFPAKSANRDKTLGHLPDMGEFLALKRLKNLLDQVNTQYALGAHLIICSDGHVFNDIVGVDDEQVMAYKDALIIMSAELCGDTISFYDLQDAYPHEALSHVRQRLVSEYAQPIASIQEQVRFDLNERALFNGLHRFLFEDFKYLYQDHSNNQIRKLAHKRTYQTMQRSHAWSKLVETTFPNAIRLSIHPHACQSGKLAFCLVPSSDTWATPWHNVVVKYDNQTVLMKRSEALRLGGKLVHPASPLSHYIMEKSPCLQ
jgi:pyoverdine/dityrosine biosynthesis protein Dit1